MNCKQIEELLPAFDASDLADAQMSEVKLHLEDCAGCRESLAQLAALEDMLLARRTEVPEVAKFLATFAEPEPTTLQRVTRLMHTLFSGPSLAAFAFLVAGYFSFLYKSQIAGLLTPQTLSTDALGVGAKMTAMLNATTTDTTILMSVYAAVGILIVASTAFMTMRFLRD